MLPTFQRRHGEWNSLDAKTWVKAAYCTLVWLGFNNLWRCAHAGIGAVPALQFFPNKYLLTTPYKNSSKRQRHGEQRRESFKVTNCSLTWLGWPSRHANCWNLSVSLIRFLTFGLLITTLKAYPNGEFASTKLRKERRHALSGSLL